MGTLEEIFRLQRAFGEKFINFDGLSDIEREVLSLEFIDHCIEELIEMRKEIPRRKHWKKLTPVNKEKLFEEYIDVLHFFIELAIINKWDASDLYNCYLKKNKVNHERQQKGY